MDPRIPTIPLKSERLNLTRYVLLDCVLWEISRRDDPGFLEGGDCYRIPIYDDRAPYPQWTGVGAKDSRAN